MSYFLSPRPPRTPVKTLFPSCFNVFETQGLCEFHHRPANWHDWTKDWFGEHLIPQLNLNTLDENASIEGKKKEEGEVDENDNIVVKNGIVYTWLKFNGIRGTLHCLVPKNCFFKQLQKKVVSPEELNLLRIDSKYLYNN